MRMKPGHANPAAQASKNSRKIQTHGIWGLKGLYRGYIGLKKGSVGFRV